jgi:hypothetical protein
MTRTIRRAFNLVDAMALIAATCVGSAAARWWFTEPPGFGGPSYDTDSLVCCAAWSLLPFVPAWAFLRLRRPRPARRRLFSQPGFQAALAVGLSLPLWHFDRAGEILPESWGARDLVGIFTHVDELGWGLARTIGPTVAIIWIATSLAGRRRAEAHWIDRTGRGLGWSWIVLWLVNGLYLIMQGTSKK